MTEVETNDGKKHLISDDEDLYDLLIEYAGGDVADYVNQRIDEMEGEMSDLRDELEDETEAGISGFFKKGELRDELLDMVEKAKDIKNDLWENMNELQEMFKELENLIKEND